MSESRKNHFKRLLWTALLNACVEARPYLGGSDMNQGGIQQSMDSMSPVERFLYNQHVVHTFDTIESCSRKCPRQCLVQEVADLMMPRYICPTKGSMQSELTPLSTSIRDNRALNEDILPFSSQYLLIVVPLLMVLLLVFLIVWCRKCNNNNSSLD
ncbi:hypothetical protein M3Y97_00281100 [Aphelenchoides bicaudatus]|nr:hypothetical protein M3Y97_00281100 [Aphelenchoides bicaudatus]